MDLLKRYGTYVALLLAVVAAVFLFIAPAIYVTHPQTGDNLLADNNAFQTIFGLENFEFNFLGFVAVLLLVIGLAIRFVPLENGYQNLIAAVLFLLAGVFLLVYPTTMPENPLTATFESGLSFPLILAAVLTFVAAVVDGLVGFVTMKDL